jgi:type I restriction enzyme S subunit
VDELMALCDRLEAAHQEREQRRDRLAVASLQRLNQPADPTAFVQHANFHLRYLTRLTARSDQIPALRETILNLAVRGYLVRQDTIEGPASELVDQIRAEQEELIRARVLKRYGRDSRWPEDETPFEIPLNWRWTQLGMLIVFGPQNGISPKPASRSDAPKAITLTATTKGTFDPRYFKRVEAAVPHDSELWLRAGDLLFQRGNTREYVGIAAYYTGEPAQFLYPDLMIKVRLSERVSLLYVHLCALALYARSYFSTHASGAQATMPKINQETLVRLPIRLPPLAEQHRIVAKVDELMALCDRLEAQLTTAQIKTHRLLEAVLHEALAHAV